MVEHILFESTHSKLQKCYLCILLAENSSNIRYFHIFIGYIYVWYHWVKLSWLKKKCTKDILAMFTFRFWILNQVKQIIQNAVQFDFR